MHGETVKYCNVFSKFAKCGKISELMLEFTGVSVPNAVIACNEEFLPRKAKGKKFPVEVRWIC
jgi:hypothetical protein